MQVVRIQDASRFRDRRAHPCRRRERTSSPAASANWSAASTGSSASVDDEGPRSSADGTGFLRGLMPELGTGRNFWGEPCARREPLPEPSALLLATERLLARCRRLLSDGTRATAGLVCCELETGWRGRSSSGEGWDMARGGGGGRGEGGGPGAGEGDLVTLGRLV